MISVCLATYNGEKYIKEQIASILKQIDSEDEIIISDDGSTDDTIKIIEGFHAENIHIIYNKWEHGYTPNFENAISLAKGEYIFLSDQDDLWEDNKVEVCLKYLRQYDFVVSDASIINANGDHIKDSFCRERRSKFGLINNLIRFSYLGCCMAFRKSILKKALPFPKNHRLCTHDNWLTLVALMYYKGIFIHQPLIRYRRHQDNVSSGGFKNNTSLCFKIRYRLYLCWNLQRIYFR